MISALWSDRPTFKKLRFGRGLNIIVTKRAENSTSGDKRNAAGKSSFLEILHFLLGSDVEPTSPLSAPELRDDVFFIDINLFGETATASRSVKDAKKINISADFSSWPVQPSISEESGEVFFSSEDWKDLLGQALLGMPSKSEIEKGSFLSFRSCISYFLRRSRTGGYVDWQRANLMQLPVDFQVNLSFLLGLDHKLPVELYKVKEKEAAKVQLQKAIKTGMLELALPSPAKLRAKHRKLEALVTKLSDEIDHFRVVESYGSLEEEANSEQQEIDRISNANMVDRELVSDIDSALKEEKAPALPDLDRLYEEAGVALPETALAKYVDVQKFHDAVVSNRREHLNSERADALARIERRDKNRVSLAARRDAIMRTLSSGGALSHYKDLNSKLRDSESEFALLTRQIEQSEKLEELKADLKVERAQIERRMNSDLRERRPIVDEAARAFDEVERRLYDDPATFDIASTRNGIEFNVYSSDIASTGVKRAQIFAFDMMLATICSRRRKWPTFIVHDSHVFDGVDGRQVASALTIGDEVSRSLLGQYIVTMNSDDLEKAEKEGNQSFANALVQPFLDDSERGGLFGFRFASPKAKTVEEFR
jgi:uncharacterized protein YydD (DUF2326 family)